MSRTIFYGPKDVRAIEVQLYLARVYNVNMTEFELQEENLIFVNFIEV